MVESEPVPGEDLLSGPKPSFAAFYLAEYTSAVHLAAAMVGSPSAAEDVAQEAFVRVHRRWEEVRDPHPYLKKAVVNACRSYHRTSKREISRHLRLSQGLRSSGTEPEAPERPDDLERALGSLPHRQRAAIVLRYYADLPDAQIASALGCRVGTVGSLVHRGLGHLRKIVER